MTGTPEKKPVRTTAFIFIALGLAGIAAIVVQHPLKLFMFIRLTASVLLIALGLWTLSRKR